MRKFIKIISLLLVIFNLFSNTAFAELEQNNGGYDIGDSVGVIVPLPGTEQPEQPQEPEEPQEPQEPAEPSQPIPPLSPEEPEEPEQPEQPVNPEQPVDPEQPVEPEQPGNQGSGSIGNGGTGVGVGGIGSGGGTGGVGGGIYKPSVKPEMETEKEQTEEVQTEMIGMTFADVKTDDWFYDDVMFVFKNKIMTGTAESEFSPNTTLNRAMMITILHRIDGDDSVYQTDIFHDVEKNSWYENAVNWGFENKIVAGTGENTFAPLNNLTREQLCVMLYNYTIHIGMEPEYTEITSYTDHEMVSDWAKDAVSWAVQEKIITGKGNNTLAPNDSATRAEAAAVIRRYTEKFANTKGE